MSDILDLNIDVTGVDTSFPVLAENQCEVRCDSAEIIPNKAGTGHNLLVIVKTTKDYPSASGGTVNSGYALRSYIPLQASDNPNFDFKQNIANLVDALFNPATDGERPAFTNELIAMMGGRECLASVKVGEYNGAPSNELKRLVAIG